MGQIKFLFSMWTTYILMDNLTSPERKVWRKEWRRKKLKPKRFYNYYAKRTLVISSFLGSICRKSKSFDSRCRVERLGGRIQYYVIDAENDKVGSDYWTGINILEFSISRNVYWAMYIFIWYVVNMLWIDIWITSSTKKSFPQWKEEV